MEIWAYRKFSSTNALNYGYFKGVMIKFFRICQNASVS